jgi:hypothetical protein
MVLIGAFRTIGAMLPQKTGEYLMIRDGACIWCQQSADDTFGWGFAFGGHN